MTLLVRRAPALLLALGACGRGGAPRDADPAPAATQLAATGRARAASIACAPPACVAPARAASWSAPRAADALSRALGVGARHDLAAVAVDASGAVHAVFALDRDGDGWADELRYARLDDSAWSAPEPVAASLAITESPQVAVDGDGAVHVVWTAHGPGGTPRAQPTEVWQRVLSAGRWSSPAPVFRDPSRFGLGAPTVAAGTDAAGVVHVLLESNGRGIGDVRVRGTHASAPAFVGRDGRMMAPAAGRPAFAYIGEAVSPARRTARADVFVATMDDPSAAPVEAYFGPETYSHYPRLLVDGGGTWHLFWLESPPGRIEPGSLLHATSADGRRWSAAEDVTPPSLRGGVIFRAEAVVDGRGRINLAFRRSDADGREPGFYYLSIDRGETSPVQPLAAPGELGPGETQLAYDRARHRVLAFWRGRDGIYRWRALAAG